MGNVWKLAKANMRKDRAQMIIFFLIITLAALLLHSSLIVIDYGAEYDKRAKERNLPDAIFYGLYEKDRVEEVLSGKEGIREWRVSDAIMPEQITVDCVRFRRSSKMDDLVFINAGDGAYLDSLSFLEKKEDVSGKKIWLNLYLARKLNLSAGDELKLTQEKLGTVTATVAGVYEDLILGSSLSYASLILDEETFQDFWDECENLAKTEGIYYWRRLVPLYYEGKGIDNPELEKLSLEAAVDGVSGTFEVRGNFKLSYVSVVNVLAAFMATFAGIILLVTVTTIAFVVKNNVEKEIRNIGALRAVGYTTKQVRSSIMTEFITLACAATVAGIALSYVTYPMVEAAYLQELSGMAWEKRLYPAYALLLLGVILIAIMMITFLATGRIKTLSPAVALRFGLESNSFQKNYFPLSKRQGNLQVLLALKSCLQNKTQNVTIFISMTLVAFAGTIAAILFYNTQIDVSKFQHMIQGDVPDAYVYFSGALGEEERAGSGDEGEESWRESARTKELMEIREELLAIPGVTQAYGLSSASGHVGEESATILYSNVCENVYCGLYEGLMALEDNEAVVAGAMAEKLGVGVGDELEVSVGDVKARFLITGLQQAVYGIGSRIYLTEGGARRLGIQTDYEYYRLRLEEPSEKEVDRVIAEARARLGSLCTKVENYYRYQRSMDNMPVLAVTIIVLLLVALSGIIVILVISLIVQNVFVRREKEFGIKKAIGFTSGQLRIQVMLSLSVIALAASLVGAALGYFLMNPLITLIFWNFGIKRAELSVLPQVSLLAALLIATACAVCAYGSSRRMKKLSAYRLIQD